MSVEQQIWDYFKNKGFTDYGIAGIMGNIYAESRCQPNNLQDNGNRILGWSDAQYTQKVDNKEYNNFVNDGYGYGLVQWTFSSLKADLYNLCKVRKKSIADIDCQLDIIYYHLQTHKILDGVKTAKSIREASDLFLLKFERPKDQGESVKATRANYGQKYYNQFVKKEVSGKMKYSNQKPLVCMMRQSSCYRGTRKMAVKGILWHSTGANNPTLKRYVQPDDNDPNRKALLDKIGVNPNGNDWNHMAIEAGLNAWVGQLADGTVAAVQTMPWDYAPWGCGAGPKGSCNNGWIQFEICEDNLNNSGYFQKAYTEACELTAYLCKLYNIDPKGKVYFNGIQVPTILCHADSNALGLGTNHGDVYHWFNKYGRTMDTVRNDVARLLQGSGNVTPSINPTPTPTPNPQPSYNRQEIGKGDSGSDVEYLQKSLISLGYSVGTYGADGDFGSATHKAVVKFQQDKNLDPDGIVGPSTWAALEIALKSSTPVADEVYRVRKAWNQPNTQAGAFKDLNNAKKMVDALGKEYHVYNSKGIEVYPAATASAAPSQQVTTTIDNNTTLPVAKTYSGVKIGHASHDERGKYTGGRPGDQDGTEVQIVNWYNQNWNYVLRPKTQALAERIARACESGCNNDNIGYSQSARNTIYIEALKVGLDLSKITTPCNCDCSSFVSTCCIIAGLPESIFYQGGNMRTTYTLVAAAQQTGQFIVYTNNNYTKSKDLLKRGDIILNSNQHVAIVLSNGANAQSSVTPTTTSQKADGYLVKVTATSLNIRSQPNSNSKINGVIKKGGVYTIVQEEGGFGRLKSGLGWIDLRYVQKR